MPHEPKELNFEILEIEDEAVEVMEDSFYAQAYESRYDESQEIENFQVEACESPFMGRIRF